MDNLDVASFDSDKYVENLLKNCSLKKIMDTESTIIKDTRTLHSDMQTLVYENYNKFISATETIRKMKHDFKKMENDMNLLNNKMKTITTYSGKITSTLEETRLHLCKLSEKHSLLKRLQFLSTLPVKLKTLILDKNYTQAVQDYRYAQKVLLQYKNQPSFQGIETDCKNIMEELKQELKKDFQFDNKAQSLTVVKIGELLMQLDENPKTLAKDMLTRGSLHLHDQITMLQDQREEDFLEFIDLGIDVFLNDLTIVVTSYYDMFFNEKFMANNDSFKEKIENDSNEFIDTNISKYLALVNERIEIEIGTCENEIILRGLDRLHRRILAMMNMCGGVKIKQSVNDIVLSAAQQLCEVHTKNLKENFMETLSFVRISLVSTKTEKSNLPELVSVIYLSVIQKVEYYLKDLLIFFDGNWSFNIRTNFKEPFCTQIIEGFLRYACEIMDTFGLLKAHSSPFLLLVLSKSCSEIKQKGVAHLIALTENYYDVDLNCRTSTSLEMKLIGEMENTAQNLLDSFVRLQGNLLSQMFKKSVENRDWLNCPEPRSVRAVIKRVIEELTFIENILSNLYESDGTATSSESSKKTQPTHHLKSNWSSLTPSRLQSQCVSRINKLFSEKMEIFTSVEFSKISIITGVIKIGLKTFLECVRLQTFSKFGLQQIQVDTHFLQMSLWKFVTDEHFVNFLLDEILESSVHRCLEPVLMEPNAVEIICERN